MPQDFRVGDLRPAIALMGACPGPGERDQQRPFAGASGTNLFRILQWIAERENAFSCDSIDEFTLMNSWPVALPNDENDKYLPNFSDLPKEHNLNRLELQFKSCAIERILCVGGHARRVCEHLLRTNRISPQLLFFYCGHPSPKHLHFHYRAFPKDIRLEVMLEQSFRVLRWNGRRRFANA